MDESEARAYLRQHAKPLARKLGLGQWNITYKLHHIDGFSGLCSRDIDYQLATIELDPESFKNEKELYETLVHELLHVVLSPFDLYRTFADRGSKDGSPEATAEQRIWSYAVENCVLNLERIWRERR